MAILSKQNAINLVKTAASAGLIAATTGNPFLALLALPQLLPQPQPSAAENTREQQITPLRTSPSLSPY